MTSFRVEDEQLPQEFDGYRIVQISDLHNDEFGKDNEKLLALIKEIKPDIIAITGDLLDSRRTSVEKALNFATKASQIAPCYYVTGNHEASASPRLPCPGYPVPVEAVLPDFRLPPSL